jgi:tetratricopeptide (TPR) repeat protein
VFRSYATLGAALLLTLTPVYAQPRLPIPVPGRFGSAAAPTPAEREFTAGETLLRRGDLDAARTRFEAARGLDARDPRPVYYLGEVARQRALWPEAEARFREAMRLRPTMAEAHASLGAVLRERGDLVGAVTALEAALRLSPGLGEARYTLALCLEDQGNTVGAEAAYRRAMTSLPEDPLPALNLGLMLASPEQITPTRRMSALAMLREAARRGRDQRNVLAAVGPAFRRLGDAAGAVAALERARGMGAPSAAVLGELAQALWVANDRPRAIEQIDAALAIAPREAPLHYLRGVMLAESEQRERAIEALRQAALLGAGTTIADRANTRIETLSVRVPPATPRGPRRSVTR